jgi:hypothetical protein
LIQASSFETTAGVGETTNFSLQVHCWISRNSAMMPFNRCEESTFAPQISSQK